MATIHMLVGIPGAGKSTYCRETLSKKYPKAIVIASDIVRDNNPQMSEDQIWPEIFRLCSSAINGGSDIIYDATNITPKVRNNFFNELANRGCKDYEKIAYYFPTNPRLCEERVKIRNLDSHERFLPIEIIDGYGKNIIAPTIEEGFKEIITVDNNKDKVCN